MTDNWKCILENCVLRSLEWKIQIKERRFSLLFLYSYKKRPIFFLLSFILSFKQQRWGQLKLCGGATSKHRNKRLAPQKQSMNDRNQCKLVDTSSQQPVNVCPCCLPSLKFWVFQHKHPLHVPSVNWVKTIGHLHVAARIQSSHSNFYKSVGVNLQMGI